MNLEKAGREKAQKAQRKEDLALAETFTRWVTTDSTPPFLLLCLLCLTVQANVVRFVASKCLVGLAESIGLNSLARSATMQQDYAKSDDQFGDQGQPPARYRGGFPEGEDSLWLSALGCLRLFHHLRLRCASRTSRPD